MERFQARIETLKRRVVSSATWQVFMNWGGPKCPRKWKMRGKRSSWILYEYGRR